MKKLFVLAGLATLSVGASAGNFIGTWSNLNSANVNTNVYDSAAVRFGVTRNSPTGGTDTLLPGNPTPFFTFCAELGETINYGTQSHDRVEQIFVGTQTWTGGTFGPITFNNSQVSQLKRLWYGILNETSWDGTKAAAYQVAQWEIVFDSGSTNLLGGGFFWDGVLTSQIYLDAQTYLSNANNVNTGQAAIYLMSDIVGSGQPWIQDQITGRLDRPPGGNTVPEPFTMGLGLAGIGVFVRRRMKSKSA